MLPEDFCLYKDNSQLMFHRMLQSNLKGSSSAAAFNRNSANGPGSPDGLNGLSWDQSEYTVREMHRGHGWHRTIPSSIMSNFDSSEDNVS